MKKNSQSLLRLSVIGIAALLLIGAQLASTAFRMGAGTPIQAAQVAYPTSQVPGEAAAPSSIDEAGPSLQQVGSPAIEPTIKNATADEASFTEADVVRYFEDYQARLNGQHAIWGYASEVPVSIAKIEFLTLRELKAKHPYIEPNVPEDTLLCYIQYKGAFKQFNDDQSVPAGAPIPRDIAFEVLDAQTGNRLVHGLDIQIR